MKRNGSGLKVAAGQGQKGKSGTHQKGTQTSVVLGKAYKVKAKRTITPPQVENVTFGDTHLQVVKETHYHLSARVGEVLDEVERISLRVAFSVWVLSLAAEKISPTIEKLGPMLMKYW